MVPLGVTGNWGSGAAVVLDLDPDVVARTDNDSDGERPALQAGGLAGALAGLAVSSDMELSVNGNSMSAVRFGQSARHGATGAFPLVRGCSWSGAGSNRRPSAFQVNRAKHYADLRKRTLLTSETALGGRCTTHASRAPEQYAGSERDDWRSPQYSSTTTVRLISRNRSDNAVITGLSNLLCLFSSRTAMPNAPPGSRPRSDRADDAGA